MHLAEIGAETGDEAFMKSNIGKPIAGDDNWAVLDEKLAAIRRMGEALALQPQPRHPDSGP